MVKFSWPGLSFGEVEPRSSMDVLQFCCVWAQNPDMDSAHATRAWSTEALLCADHPPPLSLNMAFLKIPGIDKNNQSSDADFGQILPGQGFL